MDAIILYMDTQMFAVDNETESYHLILQRMPYIHPKLIHDYILHLPHLNSRLQILTDNLKKVFYEVEPLMKEHIKFDPEYNYISSISAHIHISNMNVEEFMASPYFTELLKEQDPYNSSLLKDIMSIVFTKEQILELYRRTNHNQFRNVMLSKTDITIQDLQNLDFPSNKIPDMYNLLATTNLQEIEHNMHMNWEFTISSLIYNPTFTHDFALRHLRKIIRDTDNFNYNDEINVNEVYILQNTASYEYLKEHIKQLDFRNLSGMLLRRPTEHTEYINGLFKIMCEYPEYSWDWFLISMSKYITIEKVLERPDIPWDYVGLANNTNFNEDIIDAHPELPWKYNRKIENPHMGWKKFPYNEFNTYTEYRKKMVEKITREYMNGIFDLIRVI